MGVVQEIQNRYGAVKRIINRNFEQYTVTVLCVYALLVEFRPSQSYVADFTSQQSSNITLEIFHKQILPIRTYSYIVFLLPSMLLTDTLKYKPGIVVGTVVMVFAYSCNLRASSVGSYQLVELLFGFSSSMRISLLTYCFAAFPQPYYRRLTGYVRGYILVGRLLSAVLAQVLVSTNAVDFHTLNVISMTAVVIAFILSVAIPPTPTKNVIMTHAGIMPKDSAIPTASGLTAAFAQETQTTELNTVDEYEYDENPFNNTETILETHNVTANNGINARTNNTSDVTRDETCDQNNQSAFTEIESLADDDINLHSVQNGAAVLELNADALNNASSNTDELTSQSSTWKYTSTFSCIACLKRNFQPIWQDISRCYVDIYVLKLSIWWVVSTCVYLQLTSYAPLYWNYVAGIEDDQLLKKGAVQATSYLLGCLAAFFCAFWQWQWKVCVDLMISCIALTTGTLLIMTSQIHNLWLAYAAYITFTSLYYMTITIASFEIASQLTSEKYALIFGNNFLLGALMHCILMVALVVVATSDPQTTFILFLINGIYLIIFGLAMWFVIAKDIYRQGLKAYIASIKQLRYHEIQQNVHM